MAPFDRLGVAVFSPSVSPLAIAIPFLDHMVKHLMVGGIGTARRVAAVHIFRKESLAR